MHPQNEITRATRLIYRLSDSRGNGPNDWRPLADEARFIAKQMRRGRIPRGHFDPNSIYVGIVELSGLSEVAMREIVNPQKDVILDLRYTDPATGIAGIPWDGLKIGPLSRTSRMGTSEVFKAHCQCRIA